MTAKELGNQPAYPNKYFDFGLTKREAFAMAAITGCLSNPLAMRLDGIVQETKTPIVVAAAAREFADALCAELAKATEPAITRHESVEVTNPDGTKEIRAGKELS